MENKVLIELIVPELEEKFDIFIPITKRVGNIIALLAKAITELGIDYNLTPSMGIYNRNTSQQYNPNDLIYNTSIWHICIVLRAAS